jgi:hypothetical protein
VRQHQPVEHRRVVEKAARRRMARQAAKRRDEGGLAAQPRTAFATASSRPLTNPASRLS